MVDFTRIIAWQKSHAFVLLVYDQVKKLPDNERYGLYSQFTRAAISIAANIAEGSQKISKADKIRFLNISQGSLAECSYYIILCKDLKYISDDDAQTLRYHLNSASFFLNKYLEGIQNDNGITDL